MYMLQRYDATLYIYVMLSVLLSVEITDDVI